MSNMVFCRGCAKEIHESAPTCPSCGAVQSNISSSGNVAIQKTGFNIWGFFFSFAYYAGKGKFGKAILLGVLACIPILGNIGIPIYCGIKANEELGTNKFSWGRAIGFLAGFLFVGSAVLNGLKVMTGK